MCERALFNEVGGYDPDSRFGEDLDLCVRYVMAGFMPTHLPITSHIHRDHDANMTAHFGHAEHLEDVRNHYAKHKVALVQWLTPKQIVEVEQSIEWIDIRMRRRGSAPATIQPCPVSPTAEFHRSVP